MIIPFAFWYQCIQYMSDQMSQEHRKSQGQTKKMYSLLARIIRYFIWICSCFVFGWIISINLRYPGQNQGWERERREEVDPEGERLEEMTDGCAWWLDFWPGWRIKYQQIILLMWANHYHRNPTLPPVEISFSGRLNTFVGNLSLGQCLEITLSLFKWWNLMFSYWTLMFGMYL